MTIDPDSSEGGKKGYSALGNSRGHTPSRTSTPPPQAERARLDVKHNADQGSSRHAATSAAREREISRVGLDVDAVDDQLRRAINHTQREGTPVGSPSRKRQRINGDR